MSTDTAALRLLRTIPTPRRSERHGTGRCSTAPRELPTTTTSQLHGWANLR